MSEEIDKVKKEVLSRLSLQTEFESWGCFKFIGKQSTQGFLPCFSPYKKEKNPSCGVCVDNSSSYAGMLRIFNDSAPRQAINFFDLAREFNPKYLGWEFIDILKVYADITKVEFEIYKSKPKKDIGKMVAAYDYTNIKGDLIYQVCRYQKPDSKEKTFRQRRPSEDYTKLKPKWKWDMRGIVSIPYLIKNIVNNNPVYGVEGEKDADNLTKLGLPAFTLLGGAGKWQPEVLPYFKDKNIILLPDNDIPGKEHMQQLAYVFRDTAKSVKIVELPNLQLKDDVSDWITAGGTKKQLLELCEQAGEFEVGEDPIDEVNKQFGMIVVKSKTRIIYQQKEDRTDKEKEFLPAYEPHYLTGYDFKLLLKNRRVPNPDYSSGNKGVPKLIDLADAWLKHPKRRIFNRIIFEPGVDRPGCFNLYQGLGCKPIKGDCSLYRSHVLRNICDSNMYYYEWVMAWLARIVQNPGGEKPGTAIVLKGKKGTGKDIFMKPFSRIFEQNYVMVTKPSQVTGVFNNHLRYCIVLFVNEAWSPKDRKADGVFKSIITEEHTMIEPKGIDAFPVRSYVNCVVASNEKLIVKVGDSERRYLVMKVNERHIQDHPYFAAIDHQMYKEDGISALLYHLMYEIDVTKHNLRQAPYTNETFEQRRQTLDSFASFWFDILVDDEWRGWDGGIIKKDFYQEYKDFCDVIKSLDRLKGSSLFGKELRKYCEVGETSRPHGQPRTYSFPEKDECRQQFADKIGLPISWKIYEDSPKYSVGDI